MTRTSHLCTQTSLGAALKEFETDFWSFPFLSTENDLGKTFPVCSPLEEPPKDLPEAASEAPCAVLNDSTSMRRM